jgi:hypothetical protein
MASFVLILCTFNKYLYQSDFFPSISVAVSNKTGTHSSISGPTTWTLGVDDRLTGASALLFCRFFGSALSLLGPVPMLGFVLWFIEAKKNEMQNSTFSTTTCHRDTFHWHRIVL